MNISNYKMYSFTIYKTRNIEMHVFRYLNVKTLLNLDLNLTQHLLVILDTWSRSYN